MPAIMPRRSAGPLTVRKPGIQIGQQEFAGRIIGVTARCARVGRTSPAACVPPEFDQGRHV